MKNKSIVTLITFIVFGISISQAEIILDGSLGATDPIQGPDYQIPHNVGKQVGANLFHSFGTFNINTHESATFTGPDSIDNIISRVTGGQFSWIDGLIRSEISNANFYLLNPAGVVFGPNSSIDIDGSFHISTADYLTFGEDHYYVDPSQISSFSAQQPDAFGFSGDNPSKISIEGYLGVSENQVLSVIGGEIEIKSGAKISAPHGRINVVGVQSNGEIKPVEQDVEMTDFSMANVNLSEQALIDVSGAGSGNVFIRCGDLLLNNSVIAGVTQKDMDGGQINILANNVSLLNGAYIKTNTEGSGYGGSLYINANDTILFSGDDQITYIFSNSLENATGNAGNIHLNANRILYQDGACIYSESMGKGNGGNINIKASGDIQFSGSSEIVFFTRSPNIDAGDAGKLTIEANNISFLGGAHIGSGTMGPGKGGEVNIRAHETLLFHGEDANGLCSRIISASMSELSDGETGSINIHAKNLVFNNGSYILSSTESSGQCGDIHLVADEELLFSGIGSHKYGSNIDISTSSSKHDAGNAAKLDIEANNILFIDGAYITSETKGSGNSGDINLMAYETILFYGEDNNGNCSHINSKSESKFTGDAGNARINAKNILFKDGSFINSSTNSAGHGGDVHIIATEKIEFSGISTDRSASYISMNTFSSGDVGELKLESNNISLLDGAYINSLARSKSIGNAGDIHIIANKSIFFEGKDGNGKGCSVGSGSFSGSAGKVGNIYIDGKNILSKDGTKIFSNTEGSGQGGKIVISSSKNITFSGGFISATTNSKNDTAGNAGKVKLEANTITFLDGAVIDSSTGGSGNAGQISIKALETMRFDGEDSNGQPSGIRLNSTLNATGDCGKININSKNIFFSNGSYISSSTVSSGQGGEINIIAEEDFNFSGTATNNVGCHILLGTYSKNKNSGNAGTLNLKANNLSFLDGAFIHLNTEGAGQGGNIRIIANESIIFDGKDPNNNPSRILSASSIDATGNSGNVSINAKNIFFKNGSYITTSTFTSGQGGEINIFATEKVEFSANTPNQLGCSIHMNSYSKEDDGGNAGTFKLEAKNVSFIFGANIGSSTDGAGGGGEITIKADETILFDGSCIESFSASESKGNAGNVNLEADNISFVAGAYIETSTYGEGNGGEIRLMADDTILFDHKNNDGFGGYIINATESNGHAGSVNLNAKNIFFNNGSSIFSRTESSGKGGDISLHAKESIVFSGLGRFVDKPRGYITSGSISEKANAGDAGIITLTAKNISFFDDALISSNTSSDASAGMIFLNASESIVFSRSYIDIDTFSHLDDAGNAGKLNISAKNISFLDGAYISTTTEGCGHGGEIRLQAEDKILFSGEDNNFVCSRIISNSLSEATGDAGNIHLNAKTIFFQDSASIGSSTYNSGNGGEINIVASDDIKFFGLSSKNISSKVHCMSVSEKENAGNAGQITIEGKNISFLDGAAILVSTLGYGHGGKVTLNADETILFYGDDNKDMFSIIDSGTIFKDQGAGKAGNILINALNFSLNRGYVNSGSSGSADAGSIEIHTTNLKLQNNSAIISATTGKGNSGDIIIEALETIELSTIGSNFGTNEISVQSLADEGVFSGNGGNIFIEAGNLHLSQGSIITADTETSKDSYSGKAGFVSLKIKGETSISGVNPYGPTESDFASGIFARSSGYGNNSGKAGNISLVTGSLSITDGAQIACTSNNDANSGSIDISVDNDIYIAGDSSTIDLLPPTEAPIDFQDENPVYVFEDSISGIYAKSTSTNPESGDSGYISIQAKNLQLVDKASISSSTLGGGDAGTIHLDVKTLHMDKGASILSTSDSDAINIFAVDTIEERNDLEATIGDISQVSQSGNGKSTQYIYNGTEWIALKNQYALHQYDAHLYPIQVNQLTIYTVDTISERNLLQVSAGDMAVINAELPDDQQHFIFNGFEWIQLSNDYSISDIVDYGEIDIHFKDIISITHNTSANTISYIFNGSQWTDLPGNYSMSDISIAADIKGASGDVIRLIHDDASSDYIFQDQSWEFDADGYSVQDIIIAKALSPKPSDIVKITDKAVEQHSLHIHNGNDWIEWNKPAYTIDDVVGVGSLSIVPGDVATLIHSNTNETLRYIRVNDQWIFDKKSGNAGGIDILASENVLIKGNSSFITSVFGGGSAGQITVQSDTIDILDGASISSASKADHFGGSTGNIDIQSTDYVRILDNSRLSTEAINTVNIGIENDSMKGKISVNANQMIYLADSNITTSIRGGSGDGGDIDIDPEFVVLNNSNIIANAYEGNGGNIHIVADNFIQSSDSIIEASSALGIDGSIDIDSPDIDVASGLTILPADYMDISKWLHTPCSSKNISDISSFVVKSRDALPTPLDDLRGDSAF